jgi:hypothetical protein
MLKKEETKTIQMTKKKSFTQEAFYFGREPDDAMCFLSVRYVFTKDYLSISL